MSEKVEKAFAAAVTPEERCVDQGRGAGRDKGGHEVYQRSFCAENKMRKSVSEPILHFS